MKNTMKATDNDEFAQKRQKDKKRISINIFVCIIAFNV